MASTTGIELGPDSCVLVGVRTGHGDAEVFAVQAIEPAAWPPNDQALATQLREMRRRQRLPRSARAVVWGLPESAALDDPVTRAALSPLFAAGFRIESVLHPAQALAALSANQPRASDGSAVAWLALNTHGAAIAIVGPSGLLFSRTFDWRFEHDLTTTKAQMLQRYSLVSHLAPELRHGMEMVRAEHGLAVDTAVTCGDLPDLRSLTMPLIEELDLEVETLDSTDGLRLVGRATELAGAAPSLRLACAAALVSSSKRSASRNPLLGAAAAMVILGAVSWLGYGYWTSSQVRPARPGVSEPQQGRRSSSVPSASLARRSEPQPAAVVAAPAAKTAPPHAPRAVTTSVAVATPPTLMVPARTPAQTPSQAPVEDKTSPPVQVPPPPQITKNVSLAPMIPAIQPQAVARPLRAPVTPQLPPPVNPVLRQTTPSRQATPLKEPLPRVDSILIDRERRLAVVDGDIVGVGDAVGPRIVLQIEPGAVVLKEPSGLEVRVPLRSKGVGV